MVSSDVVKLYNAVGNRLTVAVHLLRSNGSAKLWFVLLSAVIYEWYSWYDANTTSGTLSTTSCV